MNGRFLLAIMLLLLMTAGCRPVSPLVTPTASQDTVAPIGLVVPVNDRVEHGPGEAQLERLLSSTNLFANDAVRVSDGGEALLEFGELVRLTLFNDSQLSVTMIPEENTAPIVQFYLFWGGFVGQKVPEEGGSVVVETPSGASITVAGTRFFITYDRNTDETTVGNFDGTIQLHLSGGTVNLTKGHYVQISGSNVASSERPLLLSPAQFLEEVRLTGSILTVVASLSPTTPTPTPATPDTPEPDATDTPTPTPTEVIPRGTYLVNANCRSGPGTIYPVQTTFRSGTVVRLLGRNADGSWWLVGNENVRCWSADSVLEAENGHLVPVVATPVPPTLTPTPVPPTITPTRVPPAAPTNWDLSGGCSPPDYTLDLYWVDAATNEDGYVIYRRAWDYNRDAWDDWVLLHQLPADAEFFADQRGFDGDTEYFIAAYNSAGRNGITVRMFPCLY